MNEILSVAPLTDGMKKTWLLVWVEGGGLDQKARARIPFLLVIDGKLEIPDGFKHALDNDYATEEESPF